MSRTIDAVNEEVRNTLLVAVNAITSTSPPEERIQLLREFSGQVVSTLYLLLGATVCQKKFGNLEEQDVGKLNILKDLFTPEVALQKGSDIVSEILTDIENILTKQFGE